MSVRFPAVFTSLLLGFTFLGSGTLLYGQENHHEAADESQVIVEDHQSESTHAETSEEAFNATEYILDHISDSHEWHILTKKDGQHVAIPLPVIVAYPLPLRT